MFNKRKSKRVEWEKECEGLNKNGTQQTSNSIRINKDKSPWMDFIHTSAKVNQLCSGSVLLTPADSIGLKCSLLHKKMFYLMLGPFKLETLNLAPFVGQIHNFMSYGEMAWFKDFSRGRIRASKMSLPGREGYEVSSSRTSKTRFVTDEDSVVARKVSNR